MPKLTVKALPKREWGRQLVRLNESHRDGIPRYGIAKIVNNNQKGKSVLCLVLGHDDTASIFLAYDIRKELGINTKDLFDFSIERASIFRKLMWYFNTPDPAVHIPAWIAGMSFLLGVIGVGIALFSFCGDKLQ